VVRQRGSHVFVEHKEEHARCTVIPIHGNEDLGVGILRSILRDLDISVEDLLKWLKGE
jgi:predicted RNA binding protein YcfA (HicA-like mRNA interferase family)